MAQHKGDRETVIVYHTAPMPEVVERRCAAGGGGGGETSDSGNVQGTEHCNDGLAKSHMYGHTALVRQLNAAGRQAARSLGIPVIDFERMADTHQWQAGDDASLSPGGNPSSGVLLNVFNVMLNVYDRCSCK